MQDLLSSPETTCPRAKSTHPINSPAKTPVNSTGPTASHTSTFTIFSGHPKTNIATDDFPEKKLSSSNDTDDDTTDFTFAAYNAADQDRIKARVTSHKDLGILPAKMSQAQLKELDVAQARRWRRMREVEDDYCVEVRKIGRKVTGFLDLSAELRNLIYEYALVFPQNKCVFNVRSARGESEKTLITRAGGFAPAVKILATCKQVHEEGSSVLYRSNEFRCLYLSAYGREWFHFTQSIGRNMRLIRAIRFDLPSQQEQERRKEHSFDTLGLLSDALVSFHATSNLESCTISFHIEDIHQYNDAQAVISSRLFAVINSFVTIHCLHRMENAKDQGKIPMKLERTSPLHWLDPEQAKATLNILAFECRPPAYARPGIEPHKASEEYIEDAKAICKYIYNGLASSSGLLNQNETLEETGAYKYVLKFED